MYFFQRLIKAYLFIMNLFLLTNWIIIAFLHSFMEMMYIKPVIIQDPESVYWALFCNTDQITVHYPLYEGHMFITSY